MDIGQHIEDQATRWVYLPDISTLLEYLGKKDLIELSKCSKRYRNQLERRVLEKLNIYPWINNNRNIYGKLVRNNNIQGVLELAKADLGSKHKFVKNSKLRWEITSDFSKEFTKLFPNVKELIIDSVQSKFDSVLDLKTLLSGMENLEYIKISYTFARIDSYNAENQIFPKSLKSLEIILDLSYVNHCEILSIYDTIDISYINLYSLSIVSNRMFQNLSLGMPNLKEVEIKDYGGLDQWKIVEFLKANPQLKKLSTYSVNYNEKMIETVLSSNYLERWCIDRGSWKGIEFDYLPSNYSIKYLKIFSDIPAPLTLQLITACKNLKTLDINHRIFIELDLINFEGRINLLKLSNSSPTHNPINYINSLRVFNQVNIDFFSSIENLIENYCTVELGNYRLIPLTSHSCTLKLTNKFN